MRSLVSLAQKEFHQIIELCVDFLSSSLASAAQADLARRRFADQLAAREKRSRNEEEIVAADNNYEPPASELRRTDGRTAVAASKLCPSRRRSLVLWFGRCLCWARQSITDCERRASEHLTARETPISPRPIETGTRLSAGRQRWSAERANGALIQLALSVSIVCRLRLRLDANSRQGKERTSERVALRPLTITRHETRTVAAADSRASPARRTDGQAVFLFSFAQLEQPTAGRQSLESEKLHLDERLIWADHLDGHQLPALQCQSRGGRSQATAEAKLD